jgi:hypothetical protein
MDLTAHRDEFIGLIKAWLLELQAKLPENAVEGVEEATLALDFPVLQYPQKLVSLSFDKSPLIEGTLLGIKGQYLLLDTGVLNIRNASGYELILR